MKEWEKLRGLEGKEKDGTEEEGFFVADNGNQRCSRWSSRT